MIHDPRQDPFNLGPMPPSARMITLDRQVVAADVASMFALARDVERWPALLPHYRRVRFISRTADGGGVVEMAAVRPFGLVDWPTWWVSEMQVHPGGDGPRGFATGTSGASRAAWKCCGRFGPAREARRPPFCTCGTVRRGR